MSKPFLTIEEQVGLLTSRGLIVDSETDRLLMREGYYSIINGYKDPFLDAQLSRSSGDDRYAKGTSFSNIYELFSFDRQLRELTFHYLIRAEATIRTAVSHSFSQAHRSSEDYLLQQNYCTVDEFAAYGMDAGKYASEVSLLTALLGKCARKSKAEFIVHYRDVYGAVPLWVLCNDLTFGNLEHFFNLMKPQEKKDVAKMIALSTRELNAPNPGFLEVNDMRTHLEVLVKFRNICAHDERLYCAKVGGRKDVNYLKMTWMLEHYLTHSEFMEYLKDLLGLISTGVNDASIGHVLSGLGYREFNAQLQKRLR